MKRDFQREEAIAWLIAIMWGCLVITSALGGN